MSSKRILSSLTLQLERATSQPILRHALQPSRTAAVGTAFPNTTTTQHTRPLSTTRALHLQEARPPASTTSTAATSKAVDPPSPATSAPSKIYTYEEILDHTESPRPNLILIDVREPSELHSTGHIPTAINLPITTSPDAFFLPSPEFEDRFGFPRPGPDVEVVFYCKSGVRSRAAARMAQQAGFGGKIGEFPGSWKEWEGRGGRAEKP